MSRSIWNTSKIEDQKGKVIVITGASSGLGKDIAKVMAQKNATVVMAVRNIQKGDLVKTEIQQQFPSSTIEVMQLDLGDLASVKSFADTFQTTHDRLDVLINNAGVMMCPFSKTKDGFEIQMGTNHLGPFALTGQLLPVLKNTKDSRIVNTSSLAHRQGKINFDDLNWANRNYKSMSAYSDSKLANLYHTYELSNRLKKDSEAPLVTAAHPGWTKTDLSI